MGRGGFGVQRQGTVADLGETAGLEVEWGGWVCRCDGCADVTFTMGRKRAHGQPSCVPSSGEEGPSCLVTVASS